MWHDAVEVTAIATVGLNAKYCRWILCTTTGPLHWVARWPQQNWKTVFCSLKAANFIWPALNIWHVFLGWPFRIIKMKCAVFRPRKITDFHCSAMLIWQLGRMVRKVIYILPIWGSIYTTLYILVFILVYIDPKHTRIYTRIYWPKTYMAYWDEVLVN